MPLPLIRYPLDTTGLNPDNFISGEVHTLSDKNIRALATTYGAFFAESVRVFDNRTQQLLTRGAQYYCTELLQDASLLYGKELCFLIIITDQSVSPDVSINYQVLGGYYTNTAEAIINLYQTTLNDNRPINFIDIINRPNQYTPTTHLHAAEDVYGFEYIVSALERVRSAIVLSDVPAFESTMDWLSTELESMRAYFNSQLSVNNTHVTNTNNPHNTTKAQVGLSNVVDLPLSQTTDITNLLALPLNSDDRTIPVDKYISLRNLLQYKNSIEARLRALEAL